MYKQKKLIIFLFIILSPLFLWGETYFFWDLGTGSFDAKINQYDFESNLSLSIVDMYLKEDKTNLVLNYEPLLCNFFLLKKDSVYAELPQRDLKSLFLLNTKILWIPIDNDYIWFGPYVSVNYLNPFEVTELLLSTGLELSLFMPFDFIGPFGENFLSKLFSIEAGISLSNKENKQYHFYGKVALNIGIILSFITNGLK